MIKWTEEMLKDLNILSVNDFSKKYGISKPTIRKKVNSLSNNERKEDGKMVEEKEFKMCNASELTIVPSVILNIDKLIKEGTTFYIQDSKNEIKKYEAMIQDLEHALENSFDMSDEDYIAISKNIGVIRRKRRLYKNEVELLEKNKVDCQTFIKFIQTIKEFSSEVDNRIYNTRVMKEQIGNRIIASENNLLIKELKEQAKISDDIISRLLSLEKFNIKQHRKNRREKGEVVSVDMLVGNWRELFNELDNETRNGILTDSYNVYKGVDIKEVKDYIVWNDILPDMLVEKKYFLRGGE